MACSASGGKLQVGAVDPRALAREERIGDFVDVRTAFTQGRQFQRDYVQAVVQVFTELADLRQALEVAVGRGDQAHIDLLRLHRADAANFTFLQHAQQASLGFERQFADFVEEQACRRPPLPPDRHARRWRR